MKILERVSIRFDKMKGANMNKEYIYKKIEEGKPAIILEFNFYTEFDFGIKLDSNHYGECTITRYEIDEYGTYKIPDGIPIVNCRDDIRQIYKQAIYKLKDIYQELIIDYDHIKEIYQWFERAINWLEQNVGDNEKTFYLSSLGKYNESYIKISVKNTEQVKSKYIVYIIDDYDIIEGVIEEAQNATLTLTTIETTKGKVMKYFNPKNIFKTKEDAISELKRRITEVLMDHKRIIDEYESKLDSLDK